MRTLLDTNCLLRYLLDDIPDQANIVSEAIQKGACTAPEFLAECVYVLSGAIYSFSREETVTALLTLLDEVDCDHLSAMKDALGIFRNSNFDFADCILAARHRIEGVPVLTFDKKLVKYIEKTMSEG